MNKFYNDINKIKEFLKNIYKQISYKNNQTQKLYPGNLLQSSNASIAKQISPAIPSIKEYGLSLFPTINLSEKSQLLIYFITPYSYLNKPKSKAFLRYYAAF